MKLVGLLLMLREEVLAEIIRPVGYSNVVRLCLQVAFPTLLRNRFQFLSALHTQSCFVCRLSFHYISRLPSQNDPPTIRFGADRHSCKQLRRWYLHSRPAAEAHATFPAILRPTSFQSQGATERKSDGHPDEMNAASEQAPRPRCLRHGPYP